MPQIRCVRDLAHGLDIPTALGVKRFPGCEQHGTAFSRWSLVERHQSGHVEKGPSSCGQCGTPSLLQVMLPLCPDLPFQEPYTSSFQSFRILLKDTPSEYGGKRHKQGGSHTTELIHGALEFQKNGKPLEPGSDVI
ncbi:hypothetical protein H8959_004276 [Pygathrix nigripes]